MKRITLAVLMAISGSAFAYSQDMNQNDPAAQPIFVDEVTPIAPAQPKVDDSTILSDSEKSLPDSLRNAREMELLREVNEMDSLAEDAKLPEKRFITLGFTAGPLLTTYGLAGMEGSSAGMGAGFQLGINCDLPFGATPIGQYFSIQPELLFAFYHTPLELNEFVPNGEFDDEGEPKGEFQKHDVTDDLLYMTVPINVKASARFKKGRAFVSLAPMLSLGLFGNRSTDDRNILLFQSDPDYQQEDPVLRNIDCSLYSRLGYDWDSGLTVSLGFQLGMVDMVNVSGDGLMKMRALSLNVGYNFWGE